MMTSYEKYCLLKKEKNVRDADVAKATGIGKSTFSDWKSGRSVPKQEKMQKIADYFGTSIDYMSEKTSEFADSQYGFGSFSDLNSMSKRNKTWNKDISQGSDLFSKQDMVTLSEEAKQFALAYDQAPEEVKNILRTLIKYSKPVS